jgi:hypothetical protein
MRCAAKGIRFERLAGSKERDSYVTVELACKSEHQIRGLRRVQAAVNRSEARLKHKGREGRERSDFAQVKAKPE